MKEADLFAVLIVGVALAVVLIAVALVVYFKIWSLESEADMLNAKHTAMTEGLLRAQQESDPRPRQTAPPRGTSGGGYYPVGAHPAPHQHRGPQPHGPGGGADAGVAAEAAPIAEADRMWAELKIMEERQAALAADSESRTRAVKSAFAAKVAATSIGGGAIPSAVDVSPTRSAGPGGAAAQPRRSVRFSEEPLVMDPVSLPQVTQITVPPAPAPPPPPPPSVPRAPALDTSFFATVPPPEPTVDIDNDAAVGTEGIDALLEALPTYGNTADAPEATAAMPIAATAGPNTFFTEQPAAAPMASAAPTPPPPPAPPSPPSGVSAERQAELDTVASASAATSNQFQRSDEELRLAQEKAARASEARRVAEEAAEAERRAEEERKAAERKKREDEEAAAEAAAVRAAKGGRRTDVTWH